MKTPLLALSLLVTTSVLGAETAPTPPFAVSSQGDATKLSAVEPSNATPGFSVLSQPTSLVEMQRISAETAARIGANRPKFSTAKIPNPATKPLPDLRETDKPRNQIPRLPREMLEPKKAVSQLSIEGSPEILQLPAYIVREDKVPNFKERNLLTPAGKLALAYQRRPGLRLGSLFFLSNNGIARSLLEDDFERERIAEMKDLQGLYRYTEDNTSAPASKPSQTLLRTGGPNSSPRAAR